MNQADEQALMDWTGYVRRSNLEKWLKANRIPYFRGRGGRIITTWEAANHRLIGPTKPDDDEVELE